MAAGLGFKDFTTGEVLTAADVDGYLMQGIWVFANAAARDAAVTSPQEGNFAFTKDTNGLWYYDGATWVASGATGDIEGVTAGVGISGGGTSGTVTITNSMATAITTAGDLIKGTGSGTFDRLGIGTAGQILTVNSGATAPEWASPAAGGGFNWTAVNSGGTNLTGATVITISGITNADKLFVFVTNGSAGANDVFTFRINADTGTNYNYCASILKNPATYSTGSFDFTVGNDPFRLCRQQSVSGTGQFVMGATITGGNASGAKVFTAASGGESQGSEMVWTNGVYTSSSTISSISIVSNGSNFDNGKIYVYKSA
jgi:hypothetical protein